MSRIADLVGRGVRVTVANQAKGEPTEIPADFFEGHELRAVARFDSPADVQDFAAVYAEAEIPTPFNAYGVDRMAEILESKRLAPSAPGELDTTPFGVEANRRNLEVVIDYVYRQRMIPRRFTVDELFDPVTRRLG